MALRFDDKKALVAEVATVAQSALSVVAAEYRGVPVAELGGLRAFENLVDVTRWPVPPRGADHARSTTLCYTVLHLC